jgi:hypothetical protein
MKFHFLESPMRMHDFVHLCFILRRRFAIGMQRILFDMQWFEVAGVEKLELP